MKKIIHWNIPSLLLLIFVLTGCSQATRLGEEPALKTDDARTVTLSLRAGAEVYAGTHPALEREKKINTLHAYLFNPQGVYVETVTPVAIVGADGTYKVKSTNAGSYKMVMVANHDEVTGLAGKSIDYLDQYLVTVTAGNATHDNFVMRNQGASISIVTYEDGGSDYRSTPILMERLSARFDINLLAAGYQIKSVQLKNAATQSQLYNNNGEGKQLQIGTVAPVNGMEYIAQLYSYENSSTTNHTSLEVICSYDGVDLKPFTIPFDVVKRNHLYMVKITEKPSDNFNPIDPKDRSELLGVSVEVLDWFAGTVLGVKKAELDNLIVPAMHTQYVLRSVTPNPLSFTHEAGSNQLVVLGEVNELDGAGQTLSSRPLALSDVTIQVLGSAPWLSLNGDQVTVLANTTTSLRTATVKVSVTNDPTQFVTINVTQDAYTRQYADKKYNPLSYMAKYNVTRSKIWDTAHTIPDKSNSQLLINWNDAMNLFSSSQSIQGSTESFKLPNMKEWYSIIPDGLTPYYLRFTGVSDADNLTEEVTVAGKTFNATGDYRYVSLNITGVNNGNSIYCNVALRYKGNTPAELPYKSAWLYYPAPQGGLHIYCVNVADDPAVNSVTNLDQNWWSKQISTAVYRYLPYAGNSNGFQGGSGAGYYWSTTQHGSQNSNVLAFSYWNPAGGNKFTYTNSNDVGMSVRLFSPTPLD